MSNKYYTPEIEEFYVGFEYEAIKLKTIDMAKIPKGVSLDEYIKNNKLVDEWIPLTWNKYCTFEKFFNIEYSNEIIINITVPKCIRVKYLDKEDIESLGFNIRHTSYGIYYIKNQYKIDYAWDKKLIISENNKMIVAEDFEQEGNILFMGNIKNKSELKKLLKQLNINE